MDSDADTTAEDDVFSKVTVAHNPVVVEPILGFFLFAFFPPKHLDKFFSFRLQKLVSSCVL